MKHNETSLFDAGYEESRRRFCDRLADIQNRWPAAAISSSPLSVDPGLTVDVLEAPSVGAAEHAVVMTAGEHGVEAFTGIAVMDMFLENHLGLIDPQNTALVLVHTINPWGMKHGRRVNESNVDLNRNFIWNWSAPGLFNASFEKVKPLLTPEGRIDHPLLDLDRFAHGVTRIAARGQADELKLAILVGQYSDPHGLYYGGQGHEESTRVLIEVYRRTLAKYPHVVHLDMHTGYGPPRTVSVVSSPLETRTSDELRAAFRYPWVVRTTPEEFYPIHGDMIDFVYQLRANEFPDRRLYAASLEFGTAGNSVLADIRSLWNMVVENRLYWHGAGRSRIERRIRKAFRRLFLPDDRRWRENALANAQRAITGILAAEGILQQ